MKKVVFLIMIGFIFLTSNFLIAPVSAVASYPKIAIPEDVYDFGTIKEGISVKHTFIIKNNGKGELDINAYPSCHSCTSVALSATKLLANSRAELEVTFYTAEKKGKTEITVMIQSNDPEEPVKKITIKANVIKNDYAYTVFPETMLAGKARFVLFYSATCKECAYIKDTFLPKIQQKYLRNLDVKYLEITEIDNFKTLLLLEKSFQRQIDKTPPLIFIGDDVLEGGGAIEARLDEDIAKYLAAGGCAWPKLPKGASEDASARDNSLITNKFQGLTLATVIGGGLIDGINPCAFTTIIFLLSYLTMLGKKRKELLLTGIIFTIGVFIAYFLIGVGLLEVFIRMPFIKVLGKLLSYIVAAFLGILSLVSIYDYYLAQKGRVKEIKLQLNSFLKQRIHAVIRTNSKSKTYLFASLVMGILVALIEFPCTGQVYFPIIYVLKDVGSAYRTLAFIYLVIYNIMFILPLIGVFSLAFYGTTSEQLAKVMQKHTGTVKLLTALLFAGMTILILIFTMKY